MVAELDAVAVQGEHVRWGKPGPALWCASCATASWLAMQDARAVGDAVTVQVEDDPDDPDAAILVICGGGHTWNVPPSGRPQCCACWKPIKPKGETVADYNRKLAFLEASE